MDLANLSGKLKYLKRKGVDVSVKNRKEAEKEEKQAKQSGKPKVYSMNEDETFKDQKEEDTRGKLLNYSIKDYEKWQLKQTAKLKNSDGSSQQDLAKYTYDKEIREMEKDESLNRGKVTKARLNGKGRIQINDDKKSLEQLADNLNKSTKRRYIERKKQAEKLDSSTTGGFINDKNKQFNEKLSRQFKQFDDN